jgi:hypothetical protein
MQNEQCSFTENDIVKFDIYMGFCIVENSCKMRYFHLHKIVPKYLIFHVIFQHAKVKYFAPL